MAMKFRYPILSLGAAVCLLVTVSMLLLFTHVSNSGSGSGLCIPRWSIRCEPDDCGSMYVRCGRNQKSQEVPAGKFCYKGAVVSTYSRMRSSGLLSHACERKSHTVRMNSTAEFRLKSCDCNLCTGTTKCACLCSMFKQQVSCNNKKYDNRDQARCCCPGAISSINGDGLDKSKYFSNAWSWWTEALDFGHEIMRSCLKQMCNFVRDHFTFPPRVEKDLSASCCDNFKTGCSSCR